MSPQLLLLFVAVYFGILLIVAWATGRGGNNETFFIGNRNSNWALVAFGMIGTSLSGVTFVSVPGSVGRDGFTYLQVAIGYLIGYWCVAFVLLPLYYRMGLTSIYRFLGDRLGPKSYKAGACFFILSRTLGATARLYLVVKVLHDAILANWGVPFAVSAIVILIMILLYTYQGGVKTIVWTDTLQTVCMLGGLVCCIVYLLGNLNLGLASSWAAMESKGLSKIFDWDSGHKSFFLKQLLGGAFITITMTGMDQEMMQKNISVKKLVDSQKNILTLSFTMLLVNGCFLFLGGLLHLFAAQGHIAAVGDKLFPETALFHAPVYLSVIFIIALISALFPSADGAITALTSSFCIDLIGLDKRTDWETGKKETVRKATHFGFAMIFLLFVLYFRMENNPNMIGMILKVATFTYGPLLGLFAFGILTRWAVKDRWVPYACLVGPLCCYFLETYQQLLFPGFSFGLEMLLINGGIVFLCLMAISSKRTDPVIPIG